MRLVEEWEVPADQNPNPQWCRLCLGPRSEADGCEDLDCLERSIRAGMDPDHGSEAWRKWAIRPKGYKKRGWGRSLNLASRYPDLDVAPAHEGLYALCLSTGVVKIGRSSNLRSRMESHLRSMDIYGARLVDSAHAECRWSAGAETALINTILWRVGAQYASTRETFSIRNMGDWWVVRDALFQCAYGSERLRDVA